jgi:hypothetical protein
MNLLGIDVGFSADSKTTGLACRVNGEIGSCRTTVSWDDRKWALPPGIAFSIAALDAPILPEHEGRPHRGCESVFYGGAFWNRCRPGLSHYGRTEPLRQAGHDAASQFATVVSGGCLASDLEVRRGSAIVEAFPNTFLGVLLPDVVYAHSDRKENERKSDWLTGKWRSKEHLAS